MLLPGDNIVRSVSAAAINASSDLAADYSIFAEREDGHPGYRSVVILEVAVRQIRDPVIAIAVDGNAILLAPRVVISAFRDVDARRGGSTLAGETAPGVVG